MNLISEKYFAGPRRLLCSSGFSGSGGPLESEVWLFRIVQRPRSYIAQLLITELDYRSVRKTFSLRDPSAGELAAERFSISSLLCASFLAERFCTGEPGKLHNHNFLGVTADGRLIKFATMAVLWPYYHAAIIVLSMPPRF